VVFFIVLLGLVLYGLTNYNALLDSDSYAYLCYAKDLSRGSFVGEYDFYDIFKPLWPAEGRFNLQYGLRHLINGKIYYGFEAGYPLLLAAAIKLFGFNSVYFVNPVLLLILATVYFLMIRLIFYSRPDRDLVAALSLLILLLIPPHRILLSSMKIMRDIPPLTFLIISFYCLLSFCRDKKPSLLYLFVSALFLGMASLIRLTYLLNAAPFCLFLVVCLWRRKYSGGKIFSAVIVAILGMVVFIIPVMVVDIHVNKDILFTCKLVKKYLQIISGPGKLFSTEYLGRSGAYYLGYLSRVYSPILLFCAFIGLVAGFKKRPISLFFFPLLVTHFVLFSVFRYKHSRYLLPIYTVLSFLISFGFIVLMQWIGQLWERLLKNKEDLKLPGLIAALAGIGLIIYRIILFARGEPVPFQAGDLIYFIVCLMLLGGLRGLRKFINPKTLIPVSLAGVCGLFLWNIIPPMISNESFKISDVARLKREFERYTPANSLVLSRRDLKQNIDMYTHCYSLNPRQVAYPWGLKIEEALKMVLESGTPVFIVDNEGKKKMGKYLPYLREHFELTPIARWRSDELRIHQRYYSSREYLNLYRVE